jgi:hypothetical protein
MSTALASLDESLRAMGIPIVRINLFGQVEYAPEATPAQILQGDAFAASFDLTPTGDLAREKTRAADAFANLKDYLILLIQAGQLASLDQINLLRSQTIGVAAPTWDAPSLANAAGATSPNVTVAGATFGDSVEVACSVSTQGLIAYGYVSAANTVNVRLHNGTGAAINLPSAQWKVVVRRYNATPEISVAAAKAAIVNRVNTPDVG